MKALSKRILFYAMIGALIMPNLYGCTGGTKYEKYVPKDPTIDLAVYYPAGWSQVESRGSYGSYAQVQFIEPATKGKIVKASIALTIRDIIKIDMAVPNIENITEDLISKRMKFKDAKVLSKTKIKVLDRDAFDVTISYKGMDRLYRTDAKSVDMQERIVILTKGDNVYTLDCVDIASDFKNTNKIFSHMLKTLKSR